MDVELANQSTLWNAVAIYSCKAGYSFAPGIIQTSITCLSSGVWEKTNMTCIPDDDHHSPVQLTGKDWAPQPPHSDNEGHTRSIVTPALISIGIICGLLIIILIVLGIVLAKRFQSKKSTRATPQSSTNDLIISNAKDGVYNDVGAPGFQMVVAVQPQCPPPAREEPPVNNAMPYFTRNQEPSCYDTLQSFPSVSSYNTVVTDIEQDANYIRAKRGDADGEGTKGRDMVQEKPRQVLNVGYESVHIHAECEHPLSGTEYETVRSLQQMGADSTFEIIQPNGSVRSLGKSKGKIRRSIPSALKLFLQPSSKTTEAELHEGVVPAEIMALYAQVDKTKKRKYRSGTPVNTIDVNHVSGNHICSQTETECECVQHPISDIVRFSQDSCNPGVWNGNSKDCSASTLKESKATSPIARPLPPLPTIRFIPAPQGIEPPNQTLECAQL